MTARHLGILGDQGHIRGPDIILPGSIYLALGRQIAFLLIVDGQRPAAIDHQVKHPVVPGQGLAVLGMIKDGNGHSGKRVGPPGS